MFKSKTKGRQTCVGEQKDNYLFRNSTIKSLSFSFADVANPLDPPLQNLNSKKTKLSKEINK